MVKTIVNGVPKKLPLLLLEDEVLLPTATMRISLTSEKSLKLIEARILKNNSKIGAFIGVVPNLKIGTIGTVAAILQISQFSYNDVNNGTLLITGLCRFRINRLIMEEPYPVGTVMQIDKFSIDEDDEGYDSDIVDMAAELRDMISTIVQNLDMSPVYIKKIKNMFQSAALHALPDMCMSIIKTTLDKKLEILNAIDIQERYRMVIELFGDLKEKLSSLQNAKDISKRIMFIQDKTIKPHSNDSISEFVKPNKSGIALLKNLEDDDNKELEQKLKSAGFPDNVYKIAFKEFRKLCLIPKLSPESSVLKGYLELLSDLPWNKEAAETINIQTAKELLNKQHYGLDKLKQRILEYLAVRQLRKNTTNKDSAANKTIIQDPVLCLVGPPGVGKTSIAHSIASALGRPFCRISLGGINNQSDIRGHRRTYVGAMPGRIIQAVNQTHVKNPVILLDEVDKMTSGIHGSPAAALLEVLDPAQNYSFLDHYLNVPFDLSQVMFIATANTDQNIPLALKDRLEVFNLPGYTNDEKVHIAEKHLLPKQVTQNGLNHLIEIPLDTIKLLVDHYTREAGVRNLERKLSALCRAIAVRIAENIKSVDFKDLSTRNPIVVDVTTAQKILGPFNYEASEWIDRLGRPGISVGLGWSPVGGSVLLVEVSRAPGKGKLSLTGRLGNVMKESAKIAWGWLRSHADQYNIRLSGNDVLETDVYIHFPAGAVGKDGPSAGAAIACALFSLFSQRPLLTNVAMTGELTLQGVVLPVGGIKEKVLAAYQGGFTKIILPKLCEKYLLDIPTDIKDQLRFVFVTNIDEVLQAAFEGGVERIQTNIPKCKI